MPEAQPPVTPRAGRALHRQRRNDRGAGVSQAVQRFFSRCCALRRVRSSGMRTARLMVADSEHCADMLYAVGLFVPDPFIYFEIAGKKHIVVSDLEIDRARTQASVDRV